MKMQGSERVGKSIAPRNVAMDGLDIGVHYSPQSIKRVCMDNGIFIPNHVKQGIGRGAMAAP